MHVHKYIHIQKKTIKITSKFFFFIKFQVWLKFWKMVSEKDKKNVKYLQLSYNGKTDRPTDQCRTKGDQKKLTWELSAQVSQKWHTVNVCSWFS